jgi:hypothetical protein
MMKIKMNFKVDCAIAFNVKMVDIIDEISVILDYSGFK